MTPQLILSQSLKVNLLNLKVSEDYSGFTIKELKIRLKLLGLAAGGKKTALIERLKSSRKVKSEKEESTVLDDLELKIQRIEEEYPEVLKPLPPVKEQSYSQLLEEFIVFGMWFNFDDLFSTHSSSSSLWRAVWRFHIWFTVH